MSDFIPRTPSDGLLSFYRIANKIGVLNHFLNDRAVEDLTQADMASAAMLGMSRRYRDKAMYYAMQMCKISCESMTNLEDCFLRVCWLLGGTQAEIPDDSPLGRAKKWARDHLTPASRSRGIQSLKVYNAYLE